jgi:hypothetical protein
MRKEGPDANSSGRTPILLKSVNGRQDVFWYEFLLGKERSSVAVVGAIKGNYDVEVGDTHNDLISIPHPAIENHLPDLHEIPGPESNAATHRW